MIPTLTNFSGIVSDISSGSMYVICICVYIIFWHSIWHSFWHILRHSIWHSFGRSWHLFWHTLWYLFWHSTWHLFWHSFWHFIWHLFWHSLCPSVCYSLWHVFRRRRGHPPEPGVAHSIRSDTWPTASGAGRKTGVAPLLKSRAPHLAGGEKPSLDHWLMETANFKWDLHGIWICCFFSTEGVNDETCWGALGKWWLIPGWLMVGIAPPRILFRMSQVF